MKIIFDFDGVICQTQEFWLTKMNEKYGTDYTLNDWPTYDMKENFKEDFEKILQIATGSDTSEAKAYDWTLRTIAQLQQYSDHEVVIYSKTYSEESAEQKRQFLKKHRVNIPFFPLYEGDKNEVGCDMLVDDNPDVLLKSTANNKVLVTQPWNKNFDLTGAGIIRCEHGVELYKKIWDLTYVKKEMSDE